MKFTSTSGRAQVEITGREALSLALALFGYMTAIKGNPEMQAEFEILQSVTRKLSTITDDEVRDRANKAKLN